MAIVGPVTSFILGLIFLAFGFFSVGLPVINSGDFAEIVSQMNPWGTAMFWLGSVNLLVAFFNLLPGFPLDGGRMLRSLLWRIMDNLSKATRWATRAGQGVAWLIILTGVAMIFNVQIPLLGTGLIGGIWMILIGWFLHSAAVHSYRQTIIREILEDVPVKKIMFSDVPVVPASVSVETFIDDYLMRSDEQAFLVVDGTRINGLVTLDDIRRVSRDDRQSVPVQRIMTPSENLFVIAPEEDVAEGFQRMRSLNLRQLPVVVSGQIVGMLRRKDIMRWLQIQVQGI